MLALPVASTGLQDTQPHSLHCRIYLFVNAASAFALLACTCTNSSSSSTASRSSAAKEVNRGARLGHSNALAPGFRSEGCLLSAMLLLTKLSASTDGVEQVIHAVSTQHMYSTHLCLEHKGSQFPASRTRFSWCFRTAVTFVSQKLAPCQEISSSPPLRRKSRCTSSRGLYRAQTGKPLIFQALAPSKVFCVEKGAAPTVRQPMTFTYHI
jgi:hypothetical protein